ncbi:hypothetical protein Ancab_038800 [Ancistrocladus abbreviatus]
MTGIVLMIELSRTQDEEVGDGNKYRYCSWYDFLDAMSMARNIIKNPKLGDFAIMKSNGQPVNNSSVTVDDATMAISHVIR